MRGAGSSVVGSRACRVKFNSRVDGNRVGGFRPLLTFALRVLHPRVRVRFGVHPELKHLLPSGFHDHVAVRVPAYRGDERGRREA